jgi:hypothetical protein
LTFARFWLLGLVWVAASTGCRRESPATLDAGAPDGTSSKEPTRQTLLASDGSAEPTEKAETGTMSDGATAVEPSEEPLSPEKSRHKCPSDMVDIGGRFCIDRYEASMVDDKTNTPLSPYYPPEPGTAARVFDIWDRKRLETGPEQARTISLPPLPPLEQEGNFAPRTISRQGVVPQGYTSGKMAADACRRAHKRLCTHEEWKFACRGEKDTRYPYGDEYVQGLCNVYRGTHPAAELHGDPSAGHADPRLDQVVAKDGPLLRKTGETKTCKSRWGKDAVFDMVGNLDEWIDDPDGTFVGGFFSRGTKNGCDSEVTVHPIEHWDYSIGVRCCR